MQTRKLSDTRTRTASLRVAAAVLLAAALVLLFISAPSWAQADDTAVSNLALSSTSPGEIAIAWDAPSRAPGDYRVTWKKSSGKWPSYKNANTANGGNDNSQPRSTNPPAKPQNLLAAAMHNSVSLFWDNPNDDSITGYQILRGPDAANLTVLNNDTGTTARATPTTR